MVVFAIELYGFIEDGRDIDDWGKWTLKCLLILRIRGILSEPWFIYDFVIFNCILNLYEGDDSDTVLSSPSPSPSIDFH